MSDTEAPAEATASGETPEETAGAPAEEEEAPAPAPAPAPSGDGFGGGGFGGGGFSRGDDDNAGEGTGNVSGTRLDANGDAIIDDLAMDDLMDKLRLLNYETEFCERKQMKPIPHFYFILASSNTGEQWFYFTSLVAWLFSLIGSSYQAPRQHDDPNVVSTNIIQELKSCSIPIAKVRAVKVGYGENALLVLTLLADRALEKTDVRFRTPTYAPDVYDDDADVRDDDDVDDVDDNVFQREVDSDEEDYYGVQKKDVEENAEIKPSVNPEVWAMEVEKVGPLLKIDKRSDFRDWRAHLDWILQLTRTIGKTFPDVKTVLDKVTEDISSSLEKIERRESDLSGQFAEQIENYRTLKREYSGVYEKHKRLSDAVASLSADLSSISDQLEQVKSEIDEKSTASTDMTPVHKIKAAMVGVEAEMKTMELRIGVLQHTVLKHKFRSIQEQRRAAGSATATQYSERDLLEAEGTAVPISSMTSYS